jgi:aldehyde dehydrogenase (NAD+)
VVNIVSGNRDHLTKTLAEHDDVDALWYFGDAVGSGQVEYLSAGNMKRTWVSYGRSRDWTSREQGEGAEFSAPGDPGQKYLGANGRGLILLG